jgi:hypothetical protein
MWGNIMENEKYTLTISLNVLESLGINLYSNVSAVLSEVVANSWDADAEEVRITLKPHLREIVVTDTGSGMTSQDINQKYLNVGYHRRDYEDSITPKYNRHVFGRKGIGKLALFSIANVVEVQSVKDNNGVLEKSGFIMNAHDIEKHIKRESGPKLDKSKPSQYHPHEVEPAKIDINKGTRIILREMKKEIFNLATNLRQRLARRFSIIGAKYHFAVFIDDKPITVDDRGYLKKLQYVWLIGEGNEEILNDCKNATKHGRIDGVIEGPEGYKVGGWVGTFDEQKSVDEGTNTVVVLAWGKLIHEDILKDVKEGGVFSKYLIGELRADFLDFDEKPDISTTGRQMVKEDEERFLKLKKFFKDKVLREVDRNWEPWRREGATKKALENKKISEWFGTLTPDKKKFAKKLFAKIEAFPVSNPEDKKEIYKHGIIAFETLALKDRLSVLDEIRTDEQFDVLQTLMGQIDSLEATLYSDIITGRISVLKKFEEIATSDKERMVQQYLFEHLWLLDPSWERPTENKRMEETFRKEFAKVRLSKEEERARVDIRYKTAAGKHIIIELKKYDVSVKASKLIGQIQKYKTALLKCLKTVYIDVVPPYEIICILGSAPTPVYDDEANREALGVHKARYITYDNLIKNTLDSYNRFLQKEKEVQRIRNIIKDL